MRRNSVLVGFKARRFADIQLDMERKVLERADMAALKFSGLNEMKNFCYDF